MSNITGLRPNPPSAAGLMPKPPQRTPPREMHPAAMEAAAIYSDALATVDLLNGEKQELQIQLETSLRHIRTVEETSQREIKALTLRLEQEATQKEKLQRAAITLVNHYGSVIKLLMEGKEAALRAAEVVDVKLSLEDDIAALVAQHPRNLDQK